VVYYIISITTVIILASLGRLYYHKRNIFKTNSKDPKWDCQPDN